MKKKWEGVKEEGVVGRESAHEKLERAPLPGGRQTEAVHRDQLDPPLLCAAPNHAALSYTASINVTVPGNCVNPLNGLSKLRCSG